jgi:segregation and condensation protein B
MPGKPLLYVTSKTFMDYFGINSPEDLPKIKEVLAEQLIEGTIINPEDFTDQNVAIATETPSNEDPIDDLAALENEAFDTEDDGNFSESDNFEEANEDSNEDDENSEKDPA